MTSGRNGVRLRPGTLVGQIPGVYGTGRRSAGLGVLEIYQEREYRDIERTGRLGGSAQTEIRQVVAGRGRSRRRVRGRGRNMTRKEDLCFHD